MSSTAAGYGLRPVKLIGGQPYAGSTRQIKIANGYATNLFYGAVVKIGSDGTLELMTATGATGALFTVGTIGVFMGCQYTDSVSGVRNQQYWPTGTVAADAVGYVVDDPDVLFQVKSDGPMLQADLGMNIPFSAAQSTSTGSTATGNSTSLVDASGVLATVGLGFKVVDFVDGPDASVGDAYTEILVKFNGGLAAGHSYLSPTGTAATS
jgi:hypothetical protein